MYILTTERIEKIKNKSINSMSIVLSMLCTLTMCALLLTAYYSIHRADDFSNALSIRQLEEEGYSHVGAALMFAKQIYISWQGTYSGMILQGLLSPLNVGGLLQLRIVMIVNALLFAFSVYFVGYELCKKAQIDSWGRNSLIAIFLIELIAFTEWPEVFSWFTGAVVYCMPLSLGLIGIGLMLKQKMKMGVAFSAIMLFMSVGGSLEISGTICFLLLGICSVLVIHRKLKKSHAVLFLISVIGSLLNTLAPGNFARHNVIDKSGIHILSSLIGATCKSINEFEKMCIDTPYIFLLCIVFYTAVKVGKSKKFDRLTLRILQFLALCLPIVTCFPVILGYSYSEGYLPNRCIFVEWFSLILSSIYIVFSEGILLSDSFQMSELKKDILKLGVLIIILGININNNWSILNSFTYRVWEATAREAYKESYNSMKAIYESIDNSKEDNVFIYTTISPENLPGITQVHIDENPEDWINVALARYYGKESVQYVPDFFVRKNDNETILRISKELLQIEEGYVSIFDINTITNEATPITVLAKIEGNQMYSLYNTQNGIVGIYIYSDSQGKANLKSIELEY